jgi:hypothetical protein
MVGLLDSPPRGETAMKTFQRLFTFGAGLVLSFQLLHAQQLAGTKVRDALDSATDLQAMMEALASVPPVPLAKLPKEKSKSVGYWSMQNLQWPPLPGDIFGLDVWPLGEGVYVLDDRKFDYAALTKKENSGSLMAKSAMSPMGFGGGGYSPWWAYSTNDLWLEIISVDLTNQVANLLLHNTKDTDYYQLLSKTNLLQSGDWTLGQYKFGDPGTNQTLFLPVSIVGSPMMFFRAHEADFIVAILPGSFSLAVEPLGTDPGQIGTLSIYADRPTGNTNDLIVYYRVTGMASNGVDYVTLPGMATLTNNNNYFDIDVQPITDSLVEGIESVTLTLIPTNTYLIFPEQTSATIQILDSSTTVSIDVPFPLAVEPDGPPSVPARARSFHVSRNDSRSLYTNLTVYYSVSGTASNGVDYSFLSGAVNFAPGDLETYIEINPLADNLLEGVETVKLTLVPTNTYFVDAPQHNAATNTIIDSTTTVIMGVITNLAIEPDGPPGAPSVPAFFSMNRYDSRGIYTNMAVSYVVSGTASDGVDYVFLNGTVNFAPGMQDTNIVVMPLADSVLEGLETVTVTLLNAPTNGYFLNTNINYTTGTVSINDSSTTVSLGSSSVIALEPDLPPGAPSITNSFSVHRFDSRGIYTNLLVPYVISGTASNGADYSLLSGTVNFTPGSTDTNIVIYPLSDLVSEGLESVTLTLLATNVYFIATNGTSRTNFINDVSTTTVSLGSSSVIALEPDLPPGAPAITNSFSVHRFDSRGIYTNLLVPYVISGTASNGADYSLLSGMVNFAPGFQDTNIIIYPLADSVSEGLESVTLTLLATNVYLIATNSTSRTNFINDVSTTTVSVSAGNNAVEPNASNSIAGQAGYFQVSRIDSRLFFTNLTVFYRVSGSASNAVDYTNLNGQITFSPGQTSTNVYVQPIADYMFEGDETVLLILISTNGYVVNTNNDSALIMIQDSPIATNIVRVANVSSPIGIDYSTTTNALIVSSLASGGFVIIYTNLIPSNSIVITNVVITNWSRISGLTDEVKLVTVKADAISFTNGDMYFGSSKGIGWLSADGTSSNLNWCILTNSTVTNAIPVRGSLYVDQTGLFSNNVIAVTSDNGFSSSRKGVWRVDAQAHPTLLTNLSTLHLEGVITLPNDTSKWGPWAGKIITGDEDATPVPLIYTIGTNGIVAVYDTTKFFPGGIRTEDFEIIPTNQSLYACDYDLGAVVKFSADYLTNYVGELLITEAGENAPPGKFFVVHWDAASTNFIARRFPYKHANGTDGRLEHATFAPIELPPK